MSAAVINSGPTEGLEPTVPCNSGGDTHNLISRNISENSNDIHSAAVAREAKIAHSVPETVSNKLPRGDPAEGDDDDEDDIDAEGFGNNNNNNNGCGEALSPLSSERGLRHISNNSSHCVHHSPHDDETFTAETNKDAVASTAAACRVPPTTRKVSPPQPAGGKLVDGGTKFSKKAMCAMRDAAAGGGLEYDSAQEGPSASSPSGDEPPPLSATQSGVFSLESFAPLYEIALLEIIHECERRVANAPVAAREAQRAHLRGRNAPSMAVSTHSFETVSSVAQSPSPTGSYAPSTCALTRTCSYSTSGLPEVLPLLEALGRLLRFGESAPLVFISALAYLARVTMRCCSDDLSVTAANWYRLSTVAILVSSKMYNDVGSRRVSSLFAEASGIPLPALNKLELDFLYLTDFELLLEEADVEEWVVWMEALARRHEMTTPYQQFMMGGRPVSIISTTGGDSLAPSALLERMMMTGSQVAQQQQQSPMSASFHNSYRVEDTQPPQPLALPKPIASRSGAPTTVTATAARSTQISATYTQTGQQTLSSFSASPQRTTSCGSLLWPPLTPSHTIPPSPVFGIAPAKSGVSRERLFTVVHAAAEPPSPRTLRELSRLAVGVSPSELPPPPKQMDSPIGFFKRKAPRHQHAAMHERHQSYAKHHHDYAVSVPTKNSHSGLDPEAAKPVSTSIAAASSSKNTTTTNNNNAKSDAVGGEQHADPSASNSWGMRLGLMHRVREVLDVTASLVRGSLHVMKDGTTAVGATAAPTSASASAGVPPQRTPSQQEDTDGVSDAAAEDDTYTTGSPAAGQSGAAGQGSSSASKHEEREESYADGVEEEEEGYYDEYGNFYYYDDEEGYYDVHGHYWYYDEYAAGDDTMYEEEEEEEPQAWRPPPRTHSPPAL